MTTFLNAMDRAANDGKIDIDRAVKTLDASELPELVRPERIKEVAGKLAVVLNSKDVSPAKVPVTPADDVVQILDVDGTGIFLERLGPNWHFTATTVTNAPIIFRMIEPSLSRQELKELQKSAGAWFVIRSRVPERFKQTHFLIEDWQWAAGLIAVAFLWLLQLLLVALVKLFIRRLLRHRLGGNEERVLKSIGTPIFIVVFTVALQMFLSTLDLPVDLYVQLIAWTSTIRAIALVFLGIRLIEVSEGPIRYFVMPRFSVSGDLLLPLIQKLVWLMIVVLGTVHVLSVHGINVSGLVAGLGLGGLAFALAAKDTVENIFGSVAILIDRPFKAGDLIRVDNVTGTVERIGLRTTRIRTFDHSLVSLPNSKVISSPVENMGVRPYLRSQFDLRLPYNTPATTLEAFCAGLREVLAGHPLVKHDSAAIRFNGFGASGLTIFVQFHLASSPGLDEMARKEEIFLAMLRLAESMKIHFAFDTVTTHLASTPHREEPNISEVTIAEGVQIARTIPIGWKKLTD